MTAKLRHYPEYRDSGVPWLGEVPTHWDVLPLRLRYSVNLGKMLDAKRITGQHLVPYLRNFDVQWDQIRVHDLPLMDIERHEYARYTLEPGDLLVCEGGEVGRAATWQGELPICGFQKALHRLRPLNASHEVPRFLYYMIYAASKYGVFVADGNENTIAHLTNEKLRAHRFTFPRRAEQHAIACYLDHQDRRISRLIQAKRRLIALLTEQKQAIIHRAVTRGLDPDVPLKPSGVDWLGDVPAHWESLRGKQFLVETDVRSKDGSEEQLSVSHLTGITPRDQKTVTMFKAQSYVGHKVADIGDVVVNTMWAWMAALGVSKVQGIVSPSYATYRQLVPARFEAKYLDWLLRTPTYRDIYASRSTGIRSSRLRLYPDQFLDIRYPAPPLEEQAAILNVIEVETQQINETITSTQREIDLIREYRTRLVADVVTGKLDVRQLAADLPPLAADDLPPIEELDVMSYDEVGLDDDSVFDDDA